MGTIERAVEDVGVKACTVDLGLSAFRQRHVSGTPCALPISIGSWVSTTVFSASKYKQRWGIDSIRLLHVRRASTLERSESLWRGVEVVCID